VRLFLPVIGLAALQIFAEGSDTRSIQQSAKLGIAPKFFGKIVSIGFSKSIDACAAVLLSYYAIKIPTAIIKAGIT
jgi:hypothetical protein